MFSDLSRRKLLSLISLVTAGTAVVGSRFSGRAEATQGRRRHSSIIDVHTHPLLPTYFQLLTKGSGNADGVPVQSWSVEQHIKVMDDNGIGVGIASQPSAAQYSVGTKGHALARKMNEELAGLVAQHPSRFGAFAVVPMDDMDAALKEMAYALDVLKLDGVGASTHFQGKYLGEPEYDPWFDEMNRRGVTLFVHPVTPPNFNIEESKINVSILEYMFDSTRMVTNMVLSGAKQRFNKINIISTHGGGTIPYLANRISVGGMFPWAYKNDLKLSTDQIKAGLGSFYYDLTAATSAAQLDAIRYLVPTKRLLMGFDYPLMPAQLIAPAIEDFLTYPRFYETDRCKIEFENALELFPRFHKSIRKESSW